MISQSLERARVVEVLCLKKRVDIGYTHSFAGIDAEGCPASIQAE